MDRISIECYKEEGSTTTPFDMVLRNEVSRYHIMQQAIKGGAKGNSKVALDMISLLGEVRHQITKVQEYIIATGRDPHGTFDIPKFDERCSRVVRLEKGEGGRVRRMDFL